jgi:hypothetical protein
MCRNALELAMKGKHRLDHMTKPDQRVVKEYLDFYDVESYEKSKQQ